MSCTDSRKSDPGKYEPPLPSEDLSMVALWQSKLALAIPEQMQQPYDGGSRTSVPRKICELAFS